VVVADGLPESCSKVLEAVTSHGISQKEIICKTDLSARSVKNAVKVLILLGQISESGILSDLRRKLYARRTK
jgi:hypothetical protein